MLLRLLTTRAVSNVLIFCIWNVMLHNVGLLAFTFNTFLMQKLGFGIFTVDGFLCIFSADFNSNKVFEKFSDCLWQTVEFLKVSCWALVFMPVLSAIDMHVVVYSL